MIRPAGRPRDIPDDAIFGTLWVGFILAMILVLPALGIFLALYHIMDNLVLAAIPAFGVHFVILAISDRISRRLSKLV